jgi:hypothetical protein
MLSNEAITVIIDKSFQLRFLRMLVDFDTKAESYIITDIIRKMRDLHYDHSNLKTIFDTIVIVLSEFCRGQENNQISRKDIIEIQYELSHLINTLFSLGTSEEISIVKDMVRAYYLT